eukprot:g2414.t1
MRVCAVCVLAAAVSLTILISLLYLREPVRMAEAPAQLQDLMKGGYGGLVWTLDRIHDVILTRCSEAQRPVFDPDTKLAWAAGLRAEWRPIRDELYAWEARGWRTPGFHEIDPIQVQQAPHRAWKTLLLKFYGRETSNAAHFPRTMAALRATSATTAMFSILEAGRGLEVHRGDLKALWRYHLALEVPPPSANATEQTEPLELLIAEKLFYPSGSPTFKSLPWSEGQDMLFDDTFMHSVVNARRSGRRVVLFLDVPRDDCGWVINHALTFALNHVIKHVPRARGPIERADVLHAITSGQVDENQRQGDDERDEREEAENEEL